jgi:hypothetical protein
LFWPDSIERDDDGRGLVNRIVAVPCHAALLVQGSPPAAWLRAASVTPPPRRRLPFEVWELRVAELRQRQVLPHGVFPPWMASGGDSQLSQPKDARTYSVGKECLQPTAERSTAGADGDFGWVAVARRC